MSSLSMGLLSCLCSIIGSAVGLVSPLGALAFYLTGVFFGTGAVVVWWFRERPNRPR